MKKFLSSLLFVFATMCALPAFASNKCNLFDISKLVGANNITVSGNTMTLNATNISTGKTLHEIAPDLKVGDVAYFNMDTEHSTARHYIWLQNGNVEGFWGSTPGQSRTITQEDLDGIVKFYCEEPGQTIKDLTISTGAMLTSYVPYNPLCATCQGIVRESPNLANVPDITNLINYPDSSYALAQAIAGLQPGKTYTLSANYMARYSGGARDIKFVSGSTVVMETASTLMATRTGARSSYTFTMTQQMQSIDRARIYVGNNGDQWNEYGSLTNIQIEEGSTATEYHPYGYYCADAIKIATTAYNAAAFAPVEAALESAVTTIKDVVANTIVQADAIQNLQDTKQTMPDANGTNGTCPKFRQCLLIETDDGTPQWFQIADPVHDFVTAMKNNKVNSSGQTTNYEFAARGYDGTDFGVHNSRYYRGNSAMRKLFSDDPVSSRQFDAEQTGDATLGGQYRVLGDQEWAETWDGDETGTPNSFLPGVVYGVSRCVKTSENPSSPQQPGTAGWNTIENSDPMADTDNIQEYIQCWCKVTGIGMDGDIVVVNPTTAPWVFDHTTNDPHTCANSCAFFCSNSLRDNQSFRVNSLSWMVQ